MIMSSVRKLACFLAIVILFGCIAGTGVTASGTGENLATGCRTWACHEESDSLRSACAVDGRKDTRFAAGGGCTDNTTFIVDLGCICDINKLVITWEAAYPKISVIEVSDDCKTFRTLCDNKTLSAGEQVIDGLSGSGRYIRIKENERALAQYGFSIYELEVYGKKNTDAHGTDAFMLTLNQSASVMLTADKSDFITDGDSVTVTVNTTDGSVLSALKVNGTDRFGEMSGDKLTFEMHGDTIVTPEIKMMATDKKEAETCNIYDTDGKKLSGLERADKNASGGYYVGSTGGKSFVMENVSESNRICAAYATNNTNFMSVYISADGSDNFYFAGTLPFSTTYSWGVDKQGLCYSDMIYFPEGCSVKVVPTVDVDIDYFLFKDDAAGSRENLTEGTVPAIDAMPEGAVVYKDMMAYLGESIRITKVGDKLTFAALSDGNIVNILMNCLDCRVAYYVNGEKRAESTPENTGLNHFVDNGQRIGDFKAGDSITVELTAGNDLRLDSARFVNVKDETTVKAENNPMEGERLTVSLDGIWGVAAEKFSKWSVATEFDDIEFANTIPVPGLSDMSGISLGDLSVSKLYYRKNVVLEKAPDCRVIFEIDRAQYGRYIYVNGKLADSYGYNYSQSFSDITDYLVAGNNEIIIMLGAYESQKNDPSCEGHVIYDGEKTENLQGIYDSVKLVFLNDPQVTTIKTAPDIVNGKVRVDVTLKSGESTPVRDIEDTVTVEIYELGIMRGGIAAGEKRKVAEQSVKLSMKTGQEAKISLTDIKLDGFSEEKLWTPDSPYLYSVVVRTSGDMSEVRFAMRTFNIDSETKFPMLNGKVYYLFGTTVALNRFFDDPMRENLPWNADWIRKLYSEFKGASWDTFRIHMTSAPCMWYDIADEEGMLIVDEYPLWGCDGDGCTVEQLYYEMMKIMDERCNHPSVIIWDMQNEGINDPTTTAVAKAIRSYDIQNRNWDNGWSKPITDDDWVECHPYVLGGYKPSDLDKFPRTPRISMIDIPWYTPDMVNPKILNEYGAIWLDRLGDASAGTTGLWSSWRINTREERLAYYAESMATVTQFWRAARAYIGCLTFDGLIYSKPNQGGWTGDVLMPDISTPESLEIRPYTKLLYHSTFAKLGIVIEKYAESAKRGQEISFPVTLVNDTGVKVNDLNVSLKLYYGDLLLEKYDRTMSVNALLYDGIGKSTEVFDITVPSYIKNKAVLTVIACYTDESGDEIFSQRKLKITGGSAIKELPEFTLSFDTDGGNNVDSVTVRAGDSTSLPVAEKAGYIFVAWTDADGNAVGDDFTMPMNDVRLTATWTSDGTVSTDTTDTDTYVTGTVNDGTTKPDDAQISDIAPSEETTATAAMPVEEEESYGCGCVSIPCLIIILLCALPILTEYRIKVKEEKQ